MMNPNDPLVIAALASALLGIIFLLIMVSTTVLLIRKDQL